jgi:LysR family glycine cleavage system transcriptional activator
MSAIFACFLRGFVADFLQGRAPSDHREALTDALEKLERPMRRLPPLKALHVFEAAARHGSLSAAADELGVTHSAVSQQIKLLESFFGQRLFDRGGRSLVLAPHARAYLEDVRSCFDRLALASDQLAERGNRRIIRVNATPSFAMRWLIPRLSSFQLKHPQVEVRVATSAFDTIDQLDEGYDVIIRRDAMSRDGYACERFLDDVSSPVAAPALPGLQKARSAAGLLQLPLLHLRSRPDAWVRWFRAAGVPITETLSGPFHEHFFLSLQAAIASLGVALAPRVLVEDDLEAGRLTLLFPDTTVKGRGFFALFREKSGRDRHLEQFVSWLTSAPAR